MAEDPVCYMQVDERQASSQGLTCDFQGKRYYFCCPMCKQQFEKFPERFFSRPAWQAA